MAVATAPSNGVAQKIEIPDLPLLSFTIRIIGKTPLIACRFSEDAIAKLEADQQKKAKHKLDARDPEREFEQSRYRLPDGQDGFPALGILKSIKAAAMRMTELKGTEVLAALSIDVEEHGLLAIDAPAPKMRTDHVVRVGRGNVAYRAQYWPWSITIPVTVFTPSLSPAEAINLIRNAGFGIGIGNWRPEKGGYSGKFDIDPSIQS